MIPNFSNENIFIQLTSKSSPEQVIVIVVIIIENLQLIFIHELSLVMLHCQAGFSNVHPCLHELMENICEEKENPGTHQTSICESELSPENPIPSESRSKPHNSTRVCDI